MGQESIFCYISCPTFIAFIEPRIQTIIDWTFIAFIEPRIQTIIDWSLPTLLSFLQIAITQILQLLWEASTLANEILLVKMQYLHSCDTLSCPFSFSLEKVYGCTLMQCLDSYSVVAAWPGSTYKKGFTRSVPQCYKIERIQLTWQLFQSQITKTACNYAF